MSARSFLAGLACAALITPGRSLAQEHEHASLAKLGKVVFPTSCNAEAQRRFDRGLALLHSFWYEEAGRAFQEVVAADSGCAMGYWGQAVSILHPLWNPPSETEFQAGLRAVEQASALKARTAREGDYVRAIEAYFRDYGAKDPRARALAYEEALDQLRRKYPKDNEAAIFYALMLTANTPPTDKSLERQRRAGAILEPLFQKHPNHPGLAHYVIHTYDVPGIAASGLNAARRYAQIAPSVPHARHMPSHIFIRLGMWDDVISSNLSAADAAREYEISRGMEALWDQRLHALDYLAYAYLQQGRDREAKAVDDEVRTAVGIFPEGSLTADYAIVAIAARYALERGRWDEAAGLTTRWFGRNGAAEAILHFTRGIGAARSGHPQASRMEEAKLAEIETSLAQNQRGYDWSRVAKAQRLAVGAWRAFAEGDTAGAIQLAREAADLEDATEKHPVTPGNVLPARELLADLLLEIGRPGEAGRAYAAVVERQPYRARSVFGAARAAELSGDSGNATRLYQDFVQLMARADGDRPELDVARKKVAQR